MSHEPALWQAPLLVLAGIGTGRQDLSMVALEWIGRAEVLVGGNRQLAYFQEHPARKIPLKPPLTQCLEKIKDIANEQRTMVLASGDPLFFGIGKRLINLFGKERVLVIPNITTVQYFFSRLAEPWDDVKVFSLHGRDRSEESRQWLRELRLNSKLVLFTDPAHTPNWIAAKMLENEVSEYEMVIGEDLGLATERIQKLSMDEAKKSSFSELNVVLLRRKDDREMDKQSRDPVFGLSEERFLHQAGMITKMEIRAVVLASLQLMPGLVLWDLGAGSGSVAIEAARIAPLRQVVAVEKDDVRYQDLVKNLRRLRCLEIQAVHGEALEVIDSLPAPDRVFVGGSGGNLPGILRELFSRLRPGGRVVHAVVTWDSLSTIVSFWQAKSFQIAVTQVHVNRSTPIKGSFRLEPLSPVFIVSAWSENQREV